MRATVPGGMPGSITLSPKLKYLMNYELTNLNIIPTEDTSTLTPTEESGDNLVTKVTIFSFSLILVGYIITKRIRN